MRLFEIDPHDPTARRHGVEIVGKRLHCSHCGWTEFWEKTSKSRPRQ